MCVGVRSSRASRMVRMPEGLDRGAGKSYAPTLWAGVSTTFRQRRRINHRDWISGSVALTLHILS